MAHLTLTPEQYQEALKSKDNPFVKKTPIVEHIKNVTKNIGEKTNGFWDGLIALTIVFWYFFFTGLALLFKRKLPSGWLRLATRLEKGHISHSIKKTGLRINPTRSQPQKIHKKYKVVDLETRKPIVLP